MAATVSAAAEKREESINNHCMLWLLFALAAHAGNAAVFVIDQGILHTKTQVGQPLWYAAISAIVATGAGLLLIFDFVVPSSSLIGWSLFTGVWWVIALCLFFMGLERGEASRVVPIVGVTVPVVTFMVAVLMQRERIVLSDTASILLLIIGGLLLSLPLQKTRGLSVVTVSLAVGSGAAFAMYFTAMDFVYTEFSPFLAVLAYTRLGVGVIGLVLLGVLLVLGKSVRQKQRGSSFTVKLLMAFIASKAIALFALIAQHYAIQAGSVSVVTALQGTQYIFLLLLAVIVSQQFPHLFQEEIHRVALWQKLSGIVATSIGVASLVLL